MVTTVGVANISVPPPPHPHGSNKNNTIQGAMMFMDDGHGDDRLVESAKPEQQQ